MGKWVKAGAYRKMSRDRGGDTAMEQVHMAMADARAQGYDDFKLDSKGSSIVLWKRKSE